MSQVSWSIKPEEVFSSIAKHMLRDGFDIVIDMEKSKGSRIVNMLDGKEWLDFYTFFASSPFGMNHPKLANDEFKEKIFRAAINKVANSDIYTREMAEFVKTFAEVAVPESHRHHLFFIDYGTLAVENAIKAAMDWKVRKNIEEGRIIHHGGDATYGTKVIHFKDSFHGRSGYTLSITNTADPNKYLYFAKFDWPRILNPKITFPLEDELEGVKEAEALSIKQIKNAIAKDPHGHCAIIIETIQGEGGDNHFRTEFFRELRQICDDFELLLIFDEVQCGMGITGKMWAWEHHGVAPDIFVFGKKSQICGIASSRRIEEVEHNTWVVPSRNNSTWGGNLVDMVRATRYLEIFRDDNILDYVSNTAGPALMKGLMEIQNEFSDYVCNVRGKGLMCAFDLKSVETRDKVLKKCWEKHMLVIPCGTHSIRFRPALNVPLSDIEEGLNITRWALNQVCSSAG